LRAAADSKCAGTWRKRRDAGFGDADLEVASSAAVWGSYTNCGQVCLSVERLFVEQSISEPFIQNASRRRRNSAWVLAMIEYGNRPLIRPQHVQRMSDLLADAVQRGAQVLCAAARPDLGPTFLSRRWSPAWIHP